jgi:membrane fusion protein, heavy metal efflux system
MSNRSMIALVAIPLMMMASCGKQQAEEVSNMETAYRPHAEFARLLSYEVVKEDDHAVPLTVVGEVAFDEDNVVRIYPVVSGMVEKIHFSLGDRVEKGDLLATLLSTEISQFQRDFSIAKADLEIAQKNRDRVRQLHASKFASDKELQEAENAFQNANADFIGKQKVLELFGGDPQTPDALFKVFAPRSGYLVERKVNEGTQIRVDNSENMFTISDLRSVWVLANVYESDITRVAVGDSVVATAISFPGTVFRGKVGNINRILDHESRVIKVRTEIENPEDQLLPGMFATIDIIPAQKQRTLAVPMEAVFIEKNLPHVIVCEASGEMSKRQVSTGRVFGKRLEVTQGLVSGDRILVNGSLLVANELNNRH